GPCRLSRCIRTAQNKVHAVRSGASALRNSWRIRPVSLLQAAYKGRLTAFSWLQTVLFGPTTFMQIVAFGHKPLYNPNIFCRTHLPLRQHSYMQAFSA
ncbi:MAG: hypothetical protein LUD51_05305, partial [Clostridia bacterium]|nr:hypothetical protein [Clostridia bacterium]